MNKYEMNNKLISMVTMGTHKDLLDEVITLVTTNRFTTHGNHSDY